MLTKGILSESFLYGLGKDYMRIAAVMVSAQSLNSNPDIVYKKMMLLSWKFGADSTGWVCPDHSRVLIKVDPPPNSENPFWLGGSLGWEARLLTAAVLVVSVFPNKPEQSPLDLLISVPCGLNMHALPGTGGIYLTGPGWNSSTRVCLQVPYDFAVWVLA